MRNRRKFILTLMVIIPLQLFAFDGGEDLAQQEPLKHRFPHPLNATMGLPDPVGSYNIRVNGFRQLKDNASTYDVSGHLSYGMFDWGGIHLRSLGVKTTPLTEVIGMVGLWRNVSGTQGISFLAIMGLPTGKKEAGGHHGVAFLAGLAGRFVQEDRLTNDAILHYDFSTRHFIAEIGSVLLLVQDLFATIDIRGIWGESPAQVTFLPSFKYRASPSVYVAAGYHAPISKSTPFTNQLFVQLEIGSH